MSKYKTEEQKSAFTVGLLIMFIMNIGFSLFRIEGWGPYVGLPIIIFSILYGRHYTKDKPKNKENE